MQIYLDEDVDRGLRQAAAAEGRSAAAIIRDALRSYLAGSADQMASVTADDPILAMAGRFGGMPADAAADHDRYLYGSDSFGPGSGRPTPTGDEQGAAGEPSPAAAGNG